MLSGSVLMVGIYALMSTFAPTINQLAINAQYASGGDNLSAGQRCCWSAVLITRALGQCGRFVMIAVAALVFYLCHRYEKSKRQRLSILLKKVPN